jgi:hypothetical protein
MHARSARAAHAQRACDDLPGLGSRFGTLLLERGFHPKFAVIAPHREGCGGLWEHVYHQGYDPKSIIDKVKAMVGK